MPRSLKRTEIRIVCESDKDTTPTPTFLYRQLNGREWRQVAGVNDLVEEGKLNITEQLNLIYETVAVGLAGWENMNDPETNEPIPFDVKNLDLVIDPVEASTDLMQKLLEAITPTIEDKKKLELPPASEQG